ncbi:MAG TPA: histidine phosphatase family protein [Candidatus Saccharimonadales bacterium]|jgi:broad specificity phosphatase PhoE
MAMPRDLIFVRHGQSEANIVQKNDNHNLSSEVAASIFGRPDWQQRLTIQGIEQAKYAGKWICREIGDLSSFDALYVSPFLRTRETAAHLGGPELQGWTVDDRLVERSWGVYGSLPRAEQRAQYPRTAEAKRINPWYIRLDGGESMPDVYGRFRDFQGTLHREQADKRVLVVSHGDFINVARYGVERMLPEGWEEMDATPEYTIRNCTVLHYSRVNPADPTDIRPKLAWRRYTYPDKPTASPDGGEWVALPDRQRFSGEDLLAQIELAPNLI